MTAGQQQPERDAAEPRGRDEVLADAVQVLTEAARLRRPVLQQADDGTVRTEPVDWAEFVTLAVAGAAANMGSIEKALEGRPGSWEANAVRGMLLAVAGEDPARLLQHRTEPIRVVLRPAEILADLGYTDLYDQSRQVLQDQQDRHMWRYRYSEDGQWLPLAPGAPAYADVLAGLGWPDLADPQVTAETALPRSAADESAYYALCDLEAALGELEDEQDPLVYGEALRAAVLAEAARRYPAIPVEVTVETSGQAWRGDCPYATPENELADTAIGCTPLPWSGIAPEDYPPGQSIADAERAAGRLPHLRQLAGDGLDRGAEDAR